MSRKPNFDKSYESYLKYFEKDRARGVPTNEPLSRGSYEALYKLLVRNDKVSDSDLKNMPRALYRETGRVVKSGTATAARSMFREKRGELRKRLEAGEQLSEHEMELLNASSSQKNLLKEGKNYMLYFIEIYGREEVERIVSP